MNPKPHYQPKTPLSIYLLPVPPTSSTLFQYAVAPPHAKSASEKTAPGPLGPRCPQGRDPTTTAGTTLPTRAEPLATAMFTAFHAARARALAKSKAQAPPPKSAARPRCSVRDPTPFLFRKKTISHRKKAIFQALRLIQPPGWDAEHASTPPGTDTARPSGRRQRRRTDRHRLQACQRSRCGSTTGPHLRRGRPAWGGT
jgi:hypothetical protein